MNSSGVWRGPDDPRGGSDDVSLVGRSAELEGVDGDGYELTVCELA